MLGEEEEENRDWREGINYSVNSSYCINPSYKNNCHPPWGQESKGSYKEENCINKKIDKWEDD